LGPAGLVYGLLAALTRIPADTRVAIWLLGLALVFQSFVELGAAVFAARQAVHWEFVVRLVEKVVLVGIGFLWLWHGGGLVAVCGAFVLAGLASLAATLVVLQRPGAPFAWRRAPGRARGLVREVGVVSVAFVVGFATTRLVPLIVGWLAGERAVGYLGAAIRI